MFSPVKNSLCLCFHQSRIVYVYALTSQEEFMFLLSPVKNSLCLCFDQSMTLCAYACFIQDHHVFIA